MLSAADFLVSVSSDDESEVSADEKIDKIEQFQDLLLPIPSYKINKPNITSLGALQSKSQTMAVIEVSAVIVS